MCTRYASVYAATVNVVQTACNPQAWIGQSEDHARLLQDINAALAFYALEIGPDGTLKRLGVPATTLTPPKSQDEADFDSRGFPSSRCEAWSRTVLQRAVPDSRLRVLQGV
jgi:hypothetical protein